MYVFTGWITLHVISWIINGFVVEEGLIKPWSVLIAAILVFNISQYVVMLTKLKDLYCGRMVLFVIYIVSYLIVFHGASFYLTLAPPKSLDPIEILCKGTIKNYDECYQDERQRLFFDNLFILPFSLYYGKVLFKWACMAKEKGKATDNPAA